MCISWWILSHKQLFFNNFNQNRDNSLKVICFIFSFQWCFGTAYFQTGRFQPSTRKWDQTPTFPICYVCCNISSSKIIWWNSHILESRLVYICECSLWCSSETGMVFHALIHVCLSKINACQKLRLDALLVVFFCPACRLASIEWCYFPFGFGGGGPLSSFVALGFFSPLCVAPPHPPIKSNPWAFGRQISGSNSWKFRTNLAFLFKFDW